MSVQPTKISVTQDSTTTTIASGPASTLPRPSRPPHRGQDLPPEPAAAARVPQRVEDVPQGGEDDGRADGRDDPVGNAPHDRQPASPVTRAGALSLLAVALPPVTSGS